MTRGTRDWDCMGRAREGRSQRETGGCCVPAVTQRARWRRGLRRVRVVTHGPWWATGRVFCTASAVPLGDSADGQRSPTQRQIQICEKPGRRASWNPASTYFARWMELALTISPAELTLRSNLAKEPAHQLELPLSPRLAELIPASACHPEMTLRLGSAELTLDPARQPEETPAPSRAGLTLEPVHCRPELLDACADLINEQWPRSRASRLHSLGQSSDNFPLCLVLLSPHPTPGKASIVVGHARLSRVLNRPQSLLVETVVVARALRGRGFGRCLMEGIEVFAKARGFRQLHLTTHDQLHFYAHLGYQLGEPVQGLAFASQRLPATLLSAFSRAPSPRPPCKAPSLTAQVSPRAPKGPSLPPPPPLPEPLTTSPPPPAGPPPQSLMQTRYHDLRGCPIFWMEKAL